MCVCVRKVNPEKVPLGSFPEWADSPSACARSSQTTRQNRASSWKPKPGLRHFLWGLVIRGQAVIVINVDVPGLDAHNLRPTEATGGHISDGDQALALVWEKGTSQQIKKKKRKY